ncbi:MAG: 4Fe-4S binding protein [Candidatus Omnitrophica bacterium]|nr:4Fe-4S binding protein [Candidatus Omnitrophota bacterium]
MKIRRWVVLRRISQSVFFLLFIYVLWSTTHPLNGPISPQLLFKIDPLIMIFTSLSEKVLLPGLIFAAAMLALTLVFGRFFCGWMCPLGAAIDAAGHFRKRSKKGMEEIDAANARARKPKFILLLLIAVFAVAGLQLAWVFDPLVIFARFVSLNLIPAVTFAADRSFEWLIKDLNMRGPVYDLYRSLKSSVLGINVYFFSHALSIFMYFAVICGLALFIPRLWCRSLCPLGAIYALTAKAAVLRRTVKECKDCRRCKSACRMGAIRDDSGYSKGECILCMDCIYDCPADITRFEWPFGFAQGKPAKINVGGAVTGPAGKEGITRRDFLLLSSLAVSSLGFKFDMLRSKRERKVIRPPAALEESEFIDRCVRCGNCMKVCPTNGLQPVSFQSGIEGVWTPQLVPEIGYCEYNCTLCGRTCPTGAIRKVSPDEKRVTKLGLAQVDRSICIAWAENKECVVCEEHCPVADKAIKLKRETVGGREVLRPLVDGNLCVGCGTCQNKCPTRPVRAIRVAPF